MKIARLNDGPEIFYSLQGEGASIGSPALFLRLAGCNLHCTWCDTKHSWAQGLEMSPQQVAETLKSCAPHAPRLIITGGEPLLQMEELEELLALLPPQMAVEFETNGTILPSTTLQERVTQWNISPKLAHAKQVDSLRPEILSAFTALPNSWFKFVVRGEQDWAEIAALSLPPERIILMPCAASRAELEANRLSIAQLCIAKHVRLGERLHLVLWGEKKGV